MRTIRIRIAFLAILALVVWGCEHAGPLEAIDPGGGEDNTVTFSQIQTLILDTNCAVSGCHLGGGAPFGLDLSDGVAYGNLVGVASGELPALQRIHAGDPDSSYVVWKIEGDLRIQGLRMPLGRPALSQNDIDAIRKWITDGAEDN